MRLLTAALCAALASGAAAQEPSLIGSVVRSNKWDIKRGAHKVEEFTGDVQYRREGRRLRADWALYDHDQRRIDARGAIRAEERLEDGTLASAEGERSSHDRRDGTGWLVGRGSDDPVRIHLLKPAGGEQGRGRARKLAWDLPRREARLEGDAWFREERGEIRAEVARFYHAQKKLELGGRRPTLSARGPDWAAAVQADQLTGLALDGARRRVTGKGRAHGWIHFPNKGGIRP
ncbi:MAG: hypothetical protein HYZ75_04940 [Elusimicrobia bacterium]|nr:hypothetical protein [Elusimicrobiota bacterium]